MGPCDLLIALRERALSVFWPSDELMGAPAESFQALCVFLFDRGPLLQEIRVLSRRADALLEASEEGVDADV